VARFASDEVLYRAALLGRWDRVQSRLIQRVIQSPADLFRWSDLAEASSTNTQTQKLIRTHRLNRSNIPLVRLSSLIEGAAKPHLTALASLLSTATADRIASDAIVEIIRWKTIVRCREDHDDRLNEPGNYFSVAEGVMGWQWDNVIWPIIRESDFTSTLELGCGHGRNADRLRRLAKTIDLVDINESCLSACRRRFGDSLDGCSFRYHKTEGNELKSIADRSITMLYSWDTMVHFDKIVFRDYLREIARTLAFEGRAFLHYSNLGAEQPDSDFAANHGSRSDMSGKLFFEYAQDNGLKIISHRLSGTADGWGREDLDCLTLVQR
jgi:hypothetical protein